MPARPLVYERPLCAPTQGGRSHREGPVGKGGEGAEEGAVSAAAACAGGEVGGAGYAR
jgi:hypothetical protein